MTEQLTDEQRRDRFYKMLWKSIVRKKNGQNMKSPFYEHAMFVGDPSIRKTYVRCFNPHWIGIDLELNMLVWCRSFVEMREYVETEVAIKNVLEAGR